MIVPILLRTLHVNNLVKIMKYNGVVHTQRAIKNLQKEVREILKQNQD